MQAAKLRFMSPLTTETTGRGFLILDDVTPLRQIAAKISAQSAPQLQAEASLAAQNAILFAPQTALRIRNDMNPPTPWPPEMATGTNPPDGAVIDYYLGPDLGTHPGSKISGPVTLQILNAQGELVAQFKSTDPVPPLDPRYPDPTLWARPPRVLSAAAGYHRFLWDMRYPNVPGMATGPDENAAIPHDTPTVPSGPYVMPGVYKVRLLAGGQSLSQPLTIVMDPRVKTANAQLKQQFNVSYALYQEMLQATQALHQITVLRDQLDAPGSPVARQTAEALEASLNKIAGPAGDEDGPRFGPPGAPNLSTIRTQMARLEYSIQSADQAPTAAQTVAAEQLAKPLPGLLDAWKQVKATQLKAINEQLRRENQPQLSLNTSQIDHGVEDQIEYGDDD